jgi:rhodanese-related sulfurtransferase
LLQNSLVCGKSYNKRTWALIVTKNSCNYLQWKKSYLWIIILFDMNEITVQELKEKLDKGEDFQLIDVREDFEYETSNLGGQSIPLGGILIEADKISKDKPVVVMCRSGKRSAAAIMQLEQQGFNNLSNLRGGILAWAAEIDPELSVY